MIDKSCFHKQINKGVCSNANLFDRKTAVEIPLHGEALGEWVQTEFHNEIVKFQVGSSSSPC